MLPVLLLLLLLLRLLLHHHHHHHITLPQLPILLVAMLPTFLKDILALDVWQAITSWFTSSRSAATLSDTPGTAPEELPAMPSDRPCSTPAAEDSTADVNSQHSVPVAAQNSADEPMEIK